MKVTPLITSEMPGNNASTQSEAGASFGLILDAFGGDAGGKASEQQVPGGKAVKGETKISVVTTPPLGQAARATLQPKVEEGEVLKGPDEDLEHKKLWKSADELVNFKAGQDKASAATKPEADQSIIPVLPDEAGAADEIIDAEFEEVAVELAKLEVVALPAPAVETKAVEVPIPAEAPAEMTDAEAADRDPTMPDLADPEWAQVPVAQVAAAVPYMAGVVEGEPADAPPLVAQVAASKMTRVATEGAHASEVAAHAVKTLHTLELLDDVSPGEPVEIVEGEVISFESQVVGSEAVLEPHDKSARAEVRTVEDRPASPANLGRPVLSMVTQEMLQESVASRSDGAPASFVVGGGGKLHQLPVRPSRARRRRWRSMEPTSTILW